MEYDYHIPRNIAKCAGFKQDCDRREIFGEFILNIVQFLRLGDIFTLILVIKFLYSKKNLFKKFEKFTVALKIQYFISAMVHSYSQHM